jgi:hypothetical protein
MSERERTLGAAALAIVGAIFVVGALMRQSRGEDRDDQH